MELDHNLRFRMTVWPGVPLPLPPALPRRTAYRVDGSGRAIVGDGWWEPIETRGGEVYLQLYRLDLDDPDAIIAFAYRYGLPDTTFVFDELRRHSWYAPLFAAEADLLTRQSIRERELASYVPAAPDSDEPVLLDVVPLESIRFAANLLADLTDAWRIVSDDPLFDANAHRWRLPYPVDVDTQRTPFFALQLLNAFRELLRRFSPYITGATDPDDEDLDESVAPTAPESIVRGVELHAAPSIQFALLSEYCALELFNHIVGGEVYRRCENDSCRQLFVRHYGRAEHGQSKRQGVKYCSHLCAQAVAQRDYRRRKAQQRTAEAAMATAREARASGRATRRKRNADGG